MRLDYISHSVYKNMLTGELYTSESKVRAWLYFYDKSKNSTGRNIPTIDDITEKNYDNKE